MDRPIIDMVNEELDSYIKTHKLEDNLETRLVILKKLKARIKSYEHDSILQFKMLQVISSEIAVLRCRQHIRQLPLF